MITRVTLINYKKKKKYERGLFSFESYRILNSLNTYQLSLVCDIYNAYVLI